MQGLAEEKTSDHVEDASFEVPHVLVVDDELGILDSLKRIFQREKYRVSITDSGEEALDLIRKETVDLVLADIMMPKMSGIDLLKAVKAISPSIEVVMMTAFGTIENAVDCMRQGAYDFIPKPLKRAIVVRSAQRALERRALVNENRVLRERVEEFGEDDLVGKSVSMQNCMAVLSQAAKSEATILLTGESGTGKGLLARHVHRLSLRSSKAFIAVNCAALPENLLESELFGHAKGAFTGAIERREGRFDRADRGTILLDEIAETSGAVQIRLLRVLQEGEIEPVGGENTKNVDVRVIAATNKDLDKAVHEGLFREDLFYRLNVIPVGVPPLRERHGDVVLLAHHFLRRYSEKNNKVVKGFSDAALKALDAYLWPGNVRELENVVERAVVLCCRELIGLDDLPDNIKQLKKVSTEESGESLSIPFGTPLAEIEKQVIEQTLTRTDGDKKTAARLLGIATRTIYRKMDENKEPT
ncbi:MAG: sigma-54 dependent transcriptional regulator [Myxococcota bacterium]|nr:sigma-54 dependent transcriptional regulator [Myxococcota bacterium]